MAYRNTQRALRSLTAVAATQGGYFTAQQAEQAGYDFNHLTSLAARLPMDIRQSLSRACEPNLSTDAGAPEAQKQDPVTRATACPF